MNDRLFQTVRTWLDNGAAPGGAVVLLSPDEQLSGFVHGHFSDSASPKVALDTMYDVASLTKLFTTAILLRLHERGKLSLYGRCGTYLTNFQHSKISIIDLLTHRLGMHVSLSAFCEKFDNGEQLRQALLQLEPPRNPANRVAYANIQFFYAGIIIELATGQSLREAVHALCIDLGLKHTYTGPDIAKQHLETPPTEVIGSKIVQAVTHDESARMLGGVAGSAGIFSSALDLATFGNAWLGGRIVSRSLLDEIVFRNYDPQGSDQQALGWWLRMKMPDGNMASTPGVYSHSGFTGSFLTICPRTGKTAAFTCNRTYYGRDNTKQRAIWQLLATWASA